MPILALHGFTGRGSDFAPFAELVGGEWHCPDLPGHGPNPQLDCSPKATIDFVHEQRSTLRAPGSTQKCILLGYSMGARAALQHALAHPDAWDALILISPNPGIENSAERVARCATDGKLAARIEREGVAAFIEFWQQTPMIRSQGNIRSDWRARMGAPRLEHTSKGLAASLRQFGQGQCPNLWSELSKLTMPTQVITGRHDTKYTAIAERMITQLSNHHPFRLEHCVVERSGHMPQLEAPQATAEALRNFLQRSGRA